MKHSHYVFSIMLGTVSVLLLYFSPDPVCMGFIAVMICLLALGGALGIIRVHDFNTALRRAVRKINDSGNVSSDDCWTYVRHLEVFFGNKQLDELFRKFVSDVESISAEKAGYITDIENTINEEVLEIKSFKNLVDSIPGILTGLGILGTFYGLIRGLGGIRFSSVDVVVSSISVLVTGIDTAFYSSIAGVLFSILFELVIKYEWNQMLEKLDDFLDCFHWNILPSTQMQQENRELQFYKAVISKLDEVLHEQKK